MARAKTFTGQYEAESIEKTGLKASAAELWATLAQANALFGDKAAALEQLKHSLALDRGVNTLFGGAVTLVTVGDLAAARKMLDESRRAMPAAPGPEGERSFRTIDAVIRVRAGDHSALDAIPPPTTDADMQSRFTLGLVNLRYGSADVAAARFKEIMDDRRPATSTSSGLAPPVYGRAVRNRRRARA